MSDAAPRKRDEGGTATANVADELVRLIMGELAPGSSLPSEAELAIQHGVSRVTVREAVKMVAGRGLLDLARGRRAVVREPNGAALGEFIAFVVQNDPKGVFDLVEVRMSLENQSVGLAAKRATRPALAAIESTLQAMRDAAVAMERSDNDEESGAAFHRADVGFHEAIALAGGNRILISLFEAMTQSLQRSFFMSRSGRQLRGQTSEDTILSHQRILDCIKAGDVPGAEAAMRVHLTDAVRDMRAAMDGTL